MTDALTALQQDLLNLVTTAADLAALEEVRVAALGKKGRITDMMKTLGSLPPGGAQGARVRR